MNSLQPLSSMKSSKTQEGVSETFYHGYDIHNTTQTKYNTQKREANMKTCIVGIILPKPIKTIQQIQQNIHKPYSTSYFQISNKNIKSKKSRARNMKYSEKKRKLIPFLEDL